MKRIPDMIDFFAGTSAQSRPYQVRICNKAIAMIGGHWVARDGTTPDAAKSVLIDAPTGSGKTVVALALAQYGAQQLGKRIGWVAMRRNLLQQAREMRDAFGFQIPNMRFISMFEQDPPKDVDWLIVDEAQHDATSSMAHIHNRIQPEKVIGLSATPFRSDRAQLAFERIIKDAGIHTLITEGYLSQFDHYTIPTYSPAAIAGLFQNHPEKWGKSIVFFRTMEDCAEMARLFHQIGVKTDIVWGGSDRERQIEAFRNGKLDVLISMSILTEGFDLEDLLTVFVRPSSKLPTTQMAGRVLRKCFIHEAKQIVQCQDTRHPFIKTATARMSYIQFGNNFRSLSKNENVDRVAKYYAARILKSVPKIPKFLEDQGKRRTIPLDRRSRRRRGTV
jgi:superfamily II DNA or RNA helicase